MYVYSVMHLIHSWWICNMNHVNTFHYTFCDCKGQNQSKCWYTCQGISSALNPPVTARVKISQNVDILAKVDLVHLTLLWLQGSKSVKMLIYLRALNPSVTVRVKISQNQSKFWYTCQGISSALGSSSGVVRMWVWSPAWPVVALVSLSKTLNHNCFVLRMGRKAVGLVCCVMHVKEPRTLIVKEKGLAPVFLDSHLEHPAGWICARYKSSALIFCISALKSWTLSNLTCSKYIYRSKWVNRFWLVKALSCIVEGGQNDSKNQSKMPLCTHLGQQSKQSGAWYWPL